MKTGIIFDIKELTVHDGPGVRVTVFLKGCPLRCMWCHNPEGISAHPQIMRNLENCDKCGKCSQSCAHKECAGLGACTRICHKGLVKAVGTRVQSDALASRLKKYAPVFEASGGGVTISGGEPLMQPEFLADLLHKLVHVHTAVETSGYGDTEAFLRTVMLAGLILFDIKLVDSELHKLYTGVDNRLILKNLDILKRSMRPFIARMPIIPGVNDNLRHFEQTAMLLKDVRDRVQIEILPYNPLAYAKYKSIGLEFVPDYDEHAKLNFYTEFFDAAEIPWRIL